MNLKNLFILLLAAALSGCALFEKTPPDQSGRIAGEQLEARDPELGKLAGRNLQLRKETGETVMEPPAREGSGIVGEVDIGKTLKGKPGKTGGGKATAVKLEFSDASLRDIIVVFMQDYLKQPYTFQNSFKDAQVNLFFDAKATRDDLIRLFDTLLENYGVRLRYSGGVYLIGSGGDDKTLASALQQPSPMGIGDAVGVFRVNFLDAREFLALAKQVVKYPDKMSALAGNVIIVNSTGTDVRAVQSLLQDVDTPAFSGKYILAYSPRYLSASSLVALLDNTQNQLVGGGQVGGAQGTGKQFEAKQIPDTDRIVVVAANRSVRDLIVQFLGQTDVAGGNHRRVFQYSLSTQTAADVVVNLSSLIKSVIKSSGEVTVLADKASNSLLIYASPEEYVEIRRLLARLDFRPPAVEVDMVIAEVNLNEEMRYGVEWYLKKRIGLSIADATTSLGFPAATTPNLAVNIVDSLNNYATLQLLGTETTFSLLSNPKIVVKNGATAKISVGREEPVIKQKTINNTSTNSTVIEPEFKKIGLELEVTPYVTSGNEVRMIIKLKDTDITGSKTLGGTTDVYPILSSRELSTDLVTADGKTIFLGGIRKQSMSDNAAKIPWLGDVPGAGALFRNKDKIDFGTELIILATPTVMLDQQGADIVTQAVLRASRQDFVPLHPPRKQTGLKLDAELARAPQTAGDTPDGNTAARAAPPQQTTDAPLPSAVAPAVRGEPVEPPPAVAPSQPIDVPVPAAAVVAP